MEAEAVVFRAEVRLGPGAAPIPVAGPSLASLEMNLYALTPDPEQPEPGSPT